MVGYSCLFPEKPPEWRREFPVFGAVSGTVGCLAAMEAVKVLGGFGEPLTNQLLTFDLRSMRFTKLVIEKREGWLLRNLAPCVRRNTSFYDEGAFALQCILNAAGA